MLKHDYGNDFIKNIIPYIEIKSVNLSDKRKQKIDNW